jgi:PAS domain S-box-containing protein
MATPKKLLLVEDEALIALAEAVTLRDAGYEVETAASGEAAIEAVARDPGIAMVLMDIDLGPGIDGPEAASRILSARYLPVVFLTSHSESEMVAKVREIARFGYVIKNSGEFVLLSSIEMAFELFEAQCKLARERNNMREVLESIDEAFYLKDVESGKMLFISPSYERIWGRSLEELDRDPSSFMAAIHPDDLPLVAARREEMAAGGRPFDMEYRLLRPGGELRWVHARTRRIEDPETRAPLFAAVAEDITERKLAGMNLEDERRRLLSLLASIPSLVILTGPESEAPIYVSESCLRMTGYTSEELSSGFHEFALEDDRARVAEAFSDAVGKRTEGNDFEFRARRKDGSVWYASASWRPILDDSGAYKGRFFQVTDLTAQRRAEAALRESEMKYRAIADYTVNWESWFSPSGEYLWVNRGVEGITGYTREEVLGFPDFISALIAEEDRPLFAATFKGAIRSSESSSNFEFRFIRKDGTKRWLSASWTPIYDDSGAHLGIRASGGDVTERKAAEERIAQLLAEKQLLLREVHHRIKNNMGLVASMLSLQASMIPDAAAKSALHDMRGRVMGMMILYDRLYRSEGFQRLSTSAYIGALLEGIADEFALSSVAALSWEIVDREMDSRILFPLGIIANELVTNAFKYAFPGGGGGSIRLSLEEAAPGSFELCVRDDGIGIPEAAQTGKSGGFGFLLVESLSQQLGGKLERSSAAGAGTEFRISFAGA